MRIDAAYTVNFYCSKHNIVCTSSEFRELIVLSRVFEHQLNDAKVL